MRDNDRINFVFRLQIWQFLTLTAIAFWLAGCSSTAYHKRTVAARSMNDAAADIQGEDHALEATMSSVDDLVKNPAPDLRPQLKRFSDSLDRLVAAANRAEASHRRMAQENAAYFAEWDKQLASMKFDAVRNGSETHKAEVTNHVETVNRRCLETDAAVGPLILYLQDIRAALRADLTPGALDAVKSVVANADQNADKLKLVLTQLASDISTSNSTKSPMASAAAGSTP